MKELKYSGRINLGQKYSNFFSLIILLFSHYIEKRDMVLETMAVI
jgi:hypothetical protein